MPESISDDAPPPDISDDAHSTTLDPYAILGIQRSADADEIKRAYLSACLRTHPDKNPEDAAGAERKFKQVQKAFQMLTADDAQARAAMEAMTRAEGFMSQLEALEAAESTKSSSGAAISSSSRSISASGAPVAPWRHAGKTIMRIGDGILFVGEVSEGQPHGAGELFLKDGSLHRGYFEAGRAEGRGLLYSANGAIFKGSFSKNRRVGNFEVIDPKGGRWCDAYDADGKRVKRTAAAKAEAEARAAEAEAAAKAAVAVEAKREADAAAKAAADKVAEEKIASFERMTVAQRRAAAEAKRLAGAAIRAEERKREGGGFAGFTPPASPRPSSPTEEVDQQRVGGPGFEWAASLHKSLFAVAADAAPTGAVQCKHCSARFHAAHNSSCRQHNR